MSLTVRGYAQPSSGLRTNELAFERGISRIGSGLRIRSAADDAAGLAISEGLHAQIRGGAVAARNVQDLVGALQTADGGLEAITSMLQRARDLAVRAANTGSLSGSDRATIAAEVGQLVSEIDRTAGVTSFNGRQLLDGSRPAGFVFQVGSRATETVTMAGGDVRAATLGLDGTSLTSAGSTTFGPSSYVTRSAGFDSLNLSNGNKNKFTVIVDGVSSPQLSLAKQTYGPAAHGQLVTDLNAALALDGRGVTASITGSGTTSAQLTFTSNAGSGVKVDLGGHLRDALGITIVETQGEPVVTEGNSTTTAGVAALVAAGSGDAIDVIDAALTTVLGERTRHGALQRRMEHQLSNLANTGLNLAEARSRIADADVAQEWMGVVRAQLLSQAGSALQAQGNASGQRVLQLLGSL